MLVAQLDELAAVGIVRGADVVDAILLHQLQALLDGTRIGGSTEGSQVVVVGIAFEQDFLSVELQAEVGTYLHGTNAEMVGNGIDGLSLLVIERQLDGIEIGMVGIPQLGIGNLHLGQLLLYDAGGSRAQDLCLALIDGLTIGGRNPDGDRHLLVTSTCDHLCRNGNEAILTGGDIQRMTGEIDIPVGSH